MNIRAITAVLLPTTLFYGSSAQAAFSDYFKDEFGETKWQYVANFSGSVLILLLSVLAVLLFVSYMKLRKSNRELREIRKSLEVRVKARTAELEEEIDEHRQTMSRLELSEAYIKSILDSMPLMLIGLDQDLNITQWNKQAEVLSGVESDKVIGEYLWDAYPTITLLPDQVRDILAGQKNITIKQSHTGIFYFDITIYALQRAGGTGIVILVDDVTQQTKTENTLIQRDKMSAIGELSSTMGYDILSPFHAILNCLKGMNEQLDSHEADSDFLKSRLLEAQEKGRQVSAIIDNLLRFSRSLGDEKRLTKVSEVMDHSLELAETLFFESHGLKFNDIEIVKNYEQGLSSVLTYTSGLQQVFLSLIRHACLALARSNKKDEAPVISVDIAKFYDSIWIKIQHNGLGLMAEEQQNIFEPFFQNAQVKNRGIENRLSLSYYIITEDHDGNMSVTSEVNVGTTFHIQLQVLV